MISKKQSARGSKPATRRRIPLLPIITILAWIISASLQPDIAKEAATTGLNFLKEMFQVLPPVLILSGLIAVWVPPQLIIKRLGNSSGVTGKLLSLLLGSFSAGPIYAAFPLCVTLRAKGASIGNIVIIITSWAVIKVPMIIMEFRFLGLHFTALRYVLTLPAIFGLAWLVGILVPDQNPEPEALRTQEQNNPASLPGYNCGACGFATCVELEETHGSAAAQHCVVIS